MKNLKRKEAYGGNEKEILIKLRQEDFEKANEFVLENDDENGLDTNIANHNHFISCRMVYIGSIFVA